METLVKDCYNNIIMYQRDGQKYRIIYSGYGLQVTDETSSDIVHIYGGKWVLDSWTNVPKYIATELDKIAKRFATFKDLYDYMNQVSF